jgi:hypothetical protein
MTARRKTTTKRRESPRALYVCKLEPVPTKEGEGALYLAYQDGVLHEAHAATPPDDVGALGLLGGAKPASGTKKKKKRPARACAPDLARAGAPLGFDPTPIPQGILEDRAACAVKMSMMGTSAGLDNHACLDLARASLEYFLAAPWQTWRGPNPLRARLDIESIHAACSLEVTGHQHPLLAGLLLTDEGDLARSLDLPRPHTRKMMLGVVLGERPAYVALAMDDAFRFRRAPNVVFSIGESEAPYGTWQLMALAAAMRAGAKLAGARAEAEVSGVCRAGPLEAKVTVDLPLH